MLAIIVVLTLLYVVGFATAIAQDKEPFVALHALLPVIGGAMTYLMRKVWP